MLIGPAIPDYAQVWNLYTYWGPCHAPTGRLSPRWGREWLRQPVTLARRAMGDYAPIP